MGFLTVRICKTYWTGSIVSNGIAHLGANLAGVRIDENYYVVSMAIETI